MRWARLKRRAGYGTLLLVLAAWLGAGLLGLNAYVQDYSRTRGFLPIARARTVRPGRLATVTFFSRALDRRADYVIYLPSGYSPRRRYAVVYLLHGVPGGPTAFVSVANLPVRLDNLLAEGRVSPMILVFPDGRVNGNFFSDSEWANTRTGRYESYVVEVVQDVDRRFATLRTRTGRLIGGYSAGSTGALNIALHHLNLFASVEAWSGPFEETRSGPFTAASARELRAYSPVAYAADLRAAIARWPLQVFLYGGRADPDSRNLPEMAAALQRAGARVRWAFYPGGHDWQLWNAHANQMLRVAGQYLTHPPRPRPLPAPAEPLRVRTLHLLSTHRAGVRLVIGLLLALGSAAAIDIGFLLQHRALRGAAQASDGFALLSAGLRNPAWLAGQAVGWVGFAAQVLAVAFAPLSLVQAFAAGGLALSVPIAACLFGQKVPRRVAAGASIAALALACLPVQLGHVHERLLAGALILGLCSLAAAGLLSAQRKGVVRLAIAAGLFYGAADSAIKAGFTVWPAHGPRGAFGWGLLAAGGTFAGFLCFQNALRDGNPVVTISLMNILATVVALLCGVMAFGEPLGAGPDWTEVHLLAIAAVLACVPVLADAEQRLGTDAEARQSPGTGSAVAIPSGN